MANETGPTNLKIPDGICNIPYITNSTSTFVLDAGWQDIPETVIYNLILFVFFLTIFITLRRLAWDRKHLNSKRTSKGWLQSIYGDRKLASKSLVSRDTSQVIHHKHDLQINVLTSPMIRGLNDSSHTDVVSLSRSSPSINEVFLNDTNQRSGDGDPSAPLSPNIRQNIESGGFQSIPQNIQVTFAGVGYRLRDVLLIRDADILKSRGNDALQYLLFQQYIIYFLAILCIFSILVVLPVNLQGNEFDFTQGFARTTIINIPENSPLYWVHVIGSAFISLIGIFMMHRFSKVIKMDDEQITRRTLLIRRVPRQNRNKELLAIYFQNSIPNCVIEGVQCVYDVRVLSVLTNEMTNLVNARNYCVEYSESKGKLLKIRPKAFGELGFVCACCECCQKVDGIQYYSSQEARYHQRINKEFNKAITNPTGAFFVTFQTEKMAQEAFVHLRQQQEKAYSFCPFSNTFIQVSNWCLQKMHVPRDENNLDISRWMVSYAPYPNDINWCDLSVDLGMQWLRSILVNSLLLILFVFISTPTVILNASDQLKIVQLFQWLQFLLPSDIGSRIPGLVSPFILVCASSALPAIVTLACQSIAYINMSAKNHAIMWKVYLYLLLMVIVWPSLGLTSLKAFFLTIVSKGDFPWHCLFPVKLGGFFVNYTVQYAFLGNIMELMRLPELLIYLWYMLTARSKAECNTASRYVVWDFAIGIRYPRFLLIFAMVVTYSLSCPLISVAGLIYMLIKHMIDRYNIYYVYNPSKINSKIHSTAIIFVHIAMLMMQAQIFTVTLVRTGYSRVFGLALATRKEPKTRREYCACSYLPPVLYNLTRYNVNQTPNQVVSSPAPGRSDQRPQLGQHKRHQSQPQSSIQSYLETPKTVYGKRSGRGVASATFQESGSNSGLSDDVGAIEIKVHYSNCGRNGADSDEIEPLDKKMLTQSKKP